MKRIPTYLALVAVAVLFLFPFYWVVISSLKSVEGISLKPPALYPAEAKTVTLSMPVRHWLKVGESDWLYLAPGPARFGESGDGAYYLQLEKGKPTQLVKWLTPNDGLLLKSKGGDQKFERVPVYEAEGGQVAVIAKMVRQSDERYDELLFTAPVGRPSFTEAKVLANVSNHEVRSLSVHPENFTKALAGPEATIGGESSGFLLFMRNSLFISGMAVLGQVLASSMVAFGFSRMNFRGRDGLFVLLIATLMVPAQVTLIPLFTIYKSLGWIDTFLPLIVPHFTAGAFNVFLIRQFMLTFPRELDESAEIDGASPFRIFRSIILPMCAPVLIVVGLFTFVATWQDVMGPLIYLDDPNYRTVSLGLEFFRSPYVDNRPLLMAGAVLAMLPVAALFLVAQRYIMSGIATTGLK
jgi:ABC-type glycerol-3-phosphate transport system permease component